MKRKLFIPALILLFLILSGCSLHQSISTSGPESANVSLNQVSDTKADMKSVLKKLMQNNTRCINNIFLSNSLPTQGRAITEDIYQVNVLEFKNYKEFDCYVRSVYCKKESDRLLNDYPYKNDSKYINVGGKLCINISHSSPKGYYIDWTDCKIEIDTLSDNICSFRVSAIKQEPGNDLTTQPYSVSSKAIKENDIWVLTEMIY